MTTMRTVVCPNCSENVPLPDDLTQGHCVRCGQTLSLRTSSTAIQPDIQGEYRPAPNGPQDAYVDWDDFRQNSPAVQRELMRLVSQPVPKLRFTHIEELPETAPNEIDELGELLATLKKPGDSRPLHFIGFGMASLLTLGFGILMILGGLGILGKEQPDPVGMYAVIPGGVLCVVLSVPVMWSAFTKVPKPDAAFWIFEKGLFFEQGSRVAMRVWAAIEGFRVNMENDYPVFWLAPCDDARITFTHRQGPAVVPLMEFVELHVTSAQFLPMLQRIVDGERVDFGAVELGRAGVWNRRDFFPWSEIVRVFNDSEFLFIERRNGATTGPILYRHVSFPLLVLAIARVLIEEHGRLPPADEES